MNVSPFELIDKVTHEQEVHFENDNQLISIPFQGQIIQPQSQSKQYVKSDIFLSQGQANISFSLSCQLIEVFTILKKSTLQGLLHEWKQ